MNNITNEVKRKACVNCGQKKIINKVNFEFRNDTGKFRNSCNDCRSNREELKKVRKRNTIESVREAFLSRGYILLEDKYINTKTPMKYKCPKHPDKELHMMYSNFMQGNKCPYCSKRKVDFEDIKQEFKDRGYELITDTFINTKQKLEYRCLKHPEKVRQIDYSHFNNDRGCYECGVERIKEKRKLNFEDVVKAFSEKGLELLETKYINDVTKMKYRCKKHPEIIQKTTYMVIRMGSGCSICANERMTGSSHPHWKGGVSDLSLYLRHKVKDWVSSTLKTHNYKCFITSENGSLEIHHSEPFYKVRDNALKELGLELRSEIGDYTEGELSEIVSLVLEKHNEIAGVPLKKNVHKLFHKIYGYGGTLSDLYEFRERYLNGEFCKVDKQVEQLKFIL